MLTNTRDHNQPPALVVTEILLLAAAVLPRPAGPRRTALGAGMPIIVFFDYRLKVTRKIQTFRLHKMLETV